MDPLPRARPPRTDLRRAQPRPVTTIALAIAHVGGLGFRYHAASTDRAWSGIATAPNRHTAVFDAITRIGAQDPELRRVRFVVELLSGSPLWRHAPELAVLLPGVTLEMPTEADGPLLKAADSGLADDCMPTSQPAALEPATVATDGSVRGRVTGLGWLASTGDFGLLGVPHDRRLMGASVVLIAELRAIGEAVRKLPHHRLTLLVDSQPAIQMVNKWMAGRDVLPAGYTTERASGTAGLVVAQRLIHAQRDRLDVRWVRGHEGEPLNEGADALARLASRYARGNSGLSVGEYRSRAAELAAAFAAEFNR